jgi:hypothetical protein
VSEMLKALEVITGEALGFEAVKKVVAQIRIVRTVFQEIVKNYQNGMPHGDESTFLASASCPPAARQSPFTIAPASPASWICS